MGVLLFRKTILYCGALRLKMLLPLRVNVFNNCTLVKHDADLAEPLRPYTLG
jgi:hypothetical protein